MGQTFCCAAYCVNGHWAFRAKSALAADEDARTRPLASVNPTTARCARTMALPRILVLSAGDTL
jgi:hypothetical protein